MFALEDEPEKGRRLKWILGGAVLAAGLQGGGLFAASKYEAPPKKERVLIAMTVVKPPPPPPPKEKEPEPPPPPKEKEPEPPKPEPPKPKPKPKKKKPKPKPKKKPPPPPKEAPAPPPKKPPAAIPTIGMSGVTSVKGPGPVVQIGDTLLGKTGKVAKPKPKGPAPQGDKVVNSDGPPREPVVKRAKLRKKVSTKYSKAALRAGVEGTVVLVIAIDDKGNVTKATVVKGLGFGLDEKARDAVLKWKYSPRTEDGKPVRTKSLRVKVEFKLDD